MGVNFSASSDGQFFRLLVLVGDLQVGHERVEIKYRDADLLPDGIDADFESWPQTDTGIAADELTVAADGSYGPVNVWNRAVGR